MNDRDDQALTLDAAGFNAVRMTRTGPLLYNRNDIYVGGSISAYAEFSVGEQRMFSHLVHPGEIVVEVGANIGAHTVYLSRLAGNEGEVHAFEPQRLVFQALCANLALNQCANVRALQTAVGAEPATILVPALDPAMRSNFGGVSMFGVDAGEPVPLVTIDNFDLPACHFLKIDVEGMEVEVLRGAHNTIDTYRPLMYLENDREERSAELLSLVLSADYAVYWHLPLLFNPDNFAGNAQDIFPGTVSVNILCVPNEMRLDLAGMPKVTSPDAKWRAAYDATVWPLLEARGYKNPKA